MKKQYKQYVLAVRSPKAINQESYWTGGVTLAGRPKQSNELHKAKKFLTARDAYESGKTITQLSAFRAVPMMGFRDAVSYDGFKSRWWIK